MKKKNNNKTHRNKLYKMKGCSKKRHRKYSRTTKINGGSDINLAYPNNDVIRIPNPYLAYTGKGGTIPLNTNAINKAIPNTGPPPSGNIILNSALPQRGGYGCNNAKFTPLMKGGCGCNNSTPTPTFMKGGCGCNNSTPTPTPTFMKGGCGCNNSTPTLMNGGNGTGYMLKPSNFETNLVKQSNNENLPNSQINSLMSGGKKSCGCGNNLFSFMSKNKKGGYSQCPTCGLGFMTGGNKGIPYPDGLVGSPWTSNSETWSGVNGVSGDGNYFKNNLYTNDVSRQMIATGANPPFSIGGKKYKSKTRKQKGGTFSNFLSQDLINLGRQVQYNIGSNYDTLFGYKAPVNPLPWKDQIPNTPNLATVKSMSI